MRRRSTTTRKNQANAKAGLWEVRIARFNPFEPDDSIHRLALETILPVHNKVPSEERGIKIKDLVEERLNYWSNIPESPQLLHINLPALIVSTVNVANECLDENEKIEVAHYFNELGFKASILTLK